MPTRRAGSSTATAAACTTRRAGSGAVSQAGAGSPAASSFRGRRRTPLLQPGRYTELFFLDEATAMAAGHRPCAECRRADYNRFVELWRELRPGPVGADAIDAHLHRERVDPATRRQRLHAATIGDVPDGAFVLHDGEPHLVLGRELLPWTPAGYGPPASRRPKQRVVLLTPPSLVAVLASGWEPSAVPFLHPSAGA